MIKLKFIHAPFFHFENEFNHFLSREKVERIINISFFPAMDNFGGNRIVGIVVYESDFDENQLELFKKE